MTSGAASMAYPIDLATPAGRRRARKELIWGDHGFLRLKFRNLHRISDEMYRANQPSPEHIAQYAKELGLKTILNLRGESPKGYYLLEKEACARNGIELVDFQMFSRDIPPPENVLAAKKLFDSIAYPALMHCKSGADRAGLMAVLYKHFRLGMPIAEAIEQLSLKYLHVRQGKTGMIDFFFDAYLADSAKEPMPFEQWVREKYDYATRREQFFGQWWANILVDKILRRE